MRYVAAYLLSTLGGNKSPSSTDIEKILSSVGIESDPEKLKKVISELEGKNISQLMEEGKTKLASVAAVGVAAAAPAAAAAAGAPAPAAAKAEAKKEAPKEESESDEDMGFGLFD